MDNIKYAVPTFYDLYKTGGSTLKDEKRGLRLMLQYFSGHFTGEQLIENMQRYNVENMLALIKDFFRKEFGYAAENVELNNLYQRTVNSYIYNDGKNPAVVHIDELFESTMMAFFLAMFKWSKDFADLGVYGNCYRYVLYLMNDVCILGEMQGEDAVRAMMEMIAGDLQILQLAEDCYWTVLAFSMAHEVAHAYIAAMGRKYTEEHPEREEFDADEIAYHIVLKINLISKKFLFIGFSFEDPNLDYILGQIHALLDENVAEHYCFFRKVQRLDYSNDEDYGYEKARQELRAKDLARYGIQTVFVDDYPEITAILRDIEFAVKRSNVFISGSADDYTGWGKDKAEELAGKIAQSLVKNDFRVTSGFGLGIGSSVINGALAEIYRSKYKHTDEYLCLRPFPQGIKDAKERQNVFTQYRKDMISDTGVAVFIFGNKKDSTDPSRIIDAPGCWEEFAVAKDNKSIIIPIGSTGFIAKKILDEVKADIDNYKYLEKYIDDLETENDIDKLVEIIIAIAKEQRMA